MKSKFVQNRSIYYLLFLLIFLILKDLQYYSFKKNIIFFKPPIVIYILEYLFVLFGVFFYFKNLSEVKIDKNFNKILKFYLFYSILILFISVYISNNYWEYKYIFISYLPFIFFILIFHLVSIEDNFFYLLKFYNKFLIFILLVLYFYKFYIYNEFASRFGFLVPISLIFIPYFNNFTILLIISLSIIGLFFDQSLRIFSLNIISSFILLAIFYLKITNIKIYNLIFKIIILLPFIFIFLALFLNIDIFNFLSVNLSSDESSIIFGNTRSFLFSEVYSSISNKFNLIFGSGIQASYKSYFFQNMDLIFEYGRFDTEVGFLNFILKIGFIGFFLFSILMVYPAYLGINKSNNLISKILSLKLVFLWFCLFIEYYQGVNSHYFSIFILMGILLSENFRKYNNDQILLILKKSLK